MPKDNCSQLFQYIAEKKEYPQGVDPFLHNYGNWKLMKGQQKGTKTWKCVDCNAKLVVTEAETQTVVEV